MKTLRGECRACALACWMALLLVSCSATRIVTRSSGEPEDLFTGSDRFFLERMQVSGFGFAEERDIGCILDGTLRLAFLQMARGQLAASREEADYLIVPELIVKRYRRNYQERFYCRLLVRVVGREQAASGGAAGQFGLLWGAYEYSGRLSIFEVKVQEALVEKVTGDFRERLFGGS
ncbi:MAG: hypothetical protein ACOC8N_01740 [Spirochaetota bacterium]